MAKVDVMFTWRHTENSLPHKGTLKFYVESTATEQEIALQATKEVNKCSIYHCISSIETTVV